MEDRPNQIKLANVYLRRKNEEHVELLAARDGRIEELEQQNRRQARRSQFLESRQERADRCENLVSRNDNVFLSQKAPDDTDTNRPNHGPERKKNTAAVVAARAAVAKRRVYFVPTKVPQKYFDMPQAEKDVGKKLRAVLGNKKPSEILAVDLFPGREWKLSACELPELDLDADESD